MSLNTGRQTSNAARNAGITAVIMMVYFISPTISAISPAMSSIAASYPDVPAATVGYVMTITAAFQAVTALAVGALLGRKLKYKTATIAAAAGVVIAGCFPFFLPDGAGFAALIASRAVLGVALGFIMVLSNSLVLAFFQDEGTRSKRISMGNAMLNIGTIVTNLVGGVLCAISWQTTFLTYAVGVILLLASIFLMKEPEIVAVEAGADESAADAEKKRLPAIAFVFIVLFLVVVICVQPVVVYTSQALADAGVASSMVTAGIITAFSIGGVLASAAFPSLFKRFKNAMLPIAFAVSAVAMCGCFAFCAPGGVSVAGYGVCAALAGCGLLLITCFTPLVLSQVCAPEMLPTAMGFVSFAMAMGSFLSTPFAQVVAAATGSGSVRLVMLVAGIVAAVFIVVSGSVLKGAKKSA